MTFLKDKKKIKHGNKPCVPYQLKSCLHRIKRYKRLEKPQSLKSALRKCKNYYRFAIMIAPFAIGEYVMMLILNDFLINRKEWQKRKISCATNMSFF